MKNVYDYLISRYGRENTQPNLYMMIQELQEKVKKLEEENIETTNCLYEIQNSIEAVDNRIDILYGEKNES